MGRLLKKKTSTKKTKKPDNSTGASSAAENSTAAVIPTIVSAPLPKKPQPVSKPASAPKKENFISKSIQFLREVKAELKKVVWPTRQQTLGSTLVVIVLVFAIALFLGAADVILAKLVRLALH